MWGRDEGDGRLGLGAGRGPNEGGGLRNLTPKLMHCLHLLAYFLWWVFHNGNHRRWKALELGRCFVRSQVLFEAQSTLYNLGTLHFFFFSFRTIFAFTFVERYDIEIF
ncbi:hypothetical protein Syun_020499 [Stephania yunnanensis]|uniref:Uncharacterized protein n=1 Tax=Stephania yunnanensis TaxID=152371 RepID=A0AAP0IFU1_9MAGN